MMDEIHGQIKDVDLFGSLQLLDYGTIKLAEDKLFVPPRITVDTHFTRISQHLAGRRLQRNSDQGITIYSHE